jgi:aminomethyltransferase
MSSAATLRQTALAPVHQSLGARMVEFGGWLMPVQYSGIIQEHHAVRKAAGLFDISHMGEFFLEGPDAIDNLNRILTNDIRKLGIGDGQYSLMLNEAGGVIDDLILYREGENAFFLVVNAAKIEEDAAWFEAHLQGNVTFRNDSDLYGGLALQGPKAVEVLRATFPELPAVPERNKIVSFTSEGIPLRAARTGYTGEDGFEVFFPAESSEAVLRKILKAGEPFGCVPCGLGARDTLRLEACLPLNGSDLGPTITPIEAGLKMFVSLKKPDAFIGRGVVEAQANGALKRKSVGFVSLGAGAPPRSHYQVFQGDRPVGEVTSGGVSPTLNKGIGMALVDLDVSSPGTELELDIRGRRVPVRIESKPLYRRPS